MQYQSFRGADVKQALTAVKAALGPDALIESTRRISNGRGGALGQTYVEITAAPATEEGLRRRNQPGRAQDYAQFALEATTKPMPTPMLRRPNFAQARSHAPQTPQLSGEVFDPDAIQRELMTLRGMLEELSATRRPRERAIAALKSIGIESSLARELAFGANKSGKKSPKAIRAWLMGRIAERLQIADSPIALPGRHVITCVGQTGVGKTTTLAKLAARARLDLGRSVGVITLDTFRVGAVEQWQRYSSLLGLPLGIAQNAEEFTQLLAESRSEILLVDTPGRSNMPIPGQFPLRGCLETVTGRQRHVMLVIPAWLRGCDAAAVLDQYRDPEPTGLVVTKLDETLHVGGVMHAALPNGHPITYLCDGPRVPEDIHDASTEILIDALFKNSS